ncbi:MAG: winged helix-turn-helix domain-containing protein [Xanthobacteraceae bacterium]
MKSVKFKRLDLESALVPDAPKSEGLKSLGEAVSQRRFAGLVLDFDACTLARDSGEPIPLSRGEFALLRALVSRPNRVLSRDTLLDAIASRRFESFDRSVDVLVGRLRRKIEPDPKEPRLIVTVPGEGYRFDGLTKSIPSMMEASQNASASEGRSKEPAGDATGFRTPAFGGPSAAPRLSIVVLPFANLGSDPEHEYFVDGVTESLTTDLARMDGSFVIARNTAFAFKGKPIDARALGSELNVRYVLEGSVQRRGDRMRVNVQLIDAESGKHLWAERFDKLVADFFDMQDEIVARLANQLSAELFSAEARRSERAPNPDSIDLVLQGAAWFNKGRTSENLANARSFFERALALDPGNVNALVLKAFTDVFVAVYLLSGDRDARLAAAEAATIKALSLAPDNAHAHLCLGTVFGITNRAAEGIAECERALALNRNLTNAHATIGILKLIIGRAEETEAHVEQALRLSPRDPYAHYWQMFVGLAELNLRRDEQAIVWLRRSIEGSRSNPMTHFYLATALAFLGRLEEAQAAVRAGLTLNPQFTIARFRTSSGVNPIDRAVCDRIIEGLRKAGAPEG